MAELDTSLTRGLYVDPHAGWMTFGIHAQACRNDELTTKARDASVMRTHVVPQWGDWPLAKIDHLSVQTWVSELSGRHSPATAPRPTGSPRRSCDPRSETG